MNSMPDRTPESDIEHMLREQMAAISIEFELRHWMSDRTAIIDVHRMGFGTTYQLAWLPLARLSEISRLDRYGTHRLLVVSSHISRRTADALHDAGIDHIDGAGNVHLEFGPVLIDIRGRRGPSPGPGHRSTDANLFSAKRMQVLFVLLAWPELANAPVRTIARAAGTSVGITQSTLETMKKSDYLIGGSPHRRDELIDLWAAAYRGTLMPRIHHAAYVGDTQHHSLPSDYLVSGESAVELIRQPQTLTIYTMDFDPMAAIRNGWRKSENPNIEIRQQFWREPWASAPTQDGPFVHSAAPPLLVYADLLASKEPRQAEVAAELRNDHIV